MNSSRNDEAKRRGKIQRHEENDFHDKCNVASLSLFEPNDDGLTQKGTNKLSAI